MEGQIDFLAFVFAGERKDLLVPLFVVVFVEGLLLQREKGKEDFGGIEMEGDSCQQKGDSSFETCCQRSNGRWGRRSLLGILALE